MRIDNVLVLNCANNVRLQFTGYLVIAGPAPKSSNYSLYAWSVPPEPDFGVVEYIGVIPGLVKEVSLPMFDTLCRPEAVAFCGESWCLGNLTDTWGKFAVFSEASGVECADDESGALRTDYIVAVPIDDSWKADDFTT